MSSRKFFAPLLVTAAAIVFTVPASTAIAGGKPTSPPGQAKKGTTTGTTNSGDSSGTGRKIRK